MFDLINIFEVFLPQLLRYPNPSDPLNGEAAALSMRDAQSYETKVKGELEWVFRAFTLIIHSPADYIQRFALPENVKLDQDNDDDSDVEISDQGSLPSDDQVPGAVDI